MWQRSQMKQRNIKLLRSNAHTEADHFEDDGINANGQPSNAYSMSVYLSDNP